MTPEEFSKALDAIATKFGRLKAVVETSITQAKELADVRDKALHQKIDAYKWGLILVASFAVITLGGFVALAAVLISRLMGV